MPELLEEELQSGDRITLTGIVWDTDGEDAQDIGLPADLTMTLPADWDDDCNIADLLSDKYGWCVVTPGIITRQVAA